MKKIAPIRAKAAFSLLDLLVVIAVVGVLGLIFLLGYSRKVEAKRIARCTENLHQLGTALQAYASDHDGLLPCVNDLIPWDSPSIKPWTRQLMEYYQSDSSATNQFLTCPSFSRALNKSPYSYFMGSWAAVVESDLYYFTNVSMNRILHPQQYILSGDTNNRVFQHGDADPDNATYETLFSSRSPVHNANVNILKADMSVQLANKFDPATMTYSYTEEGLEWRRPEENVRQPPDPIVSTQ